MPIKPIWKKITQYLIYILDIKKNSTFSKYEKINYTPVSDGNKIMYRKKS